MTTVADLLAFLEAGTGHRLNPDEGVLYGSPERVVRGVTVCWMGTAAAIEEAGRRGDDLVLAHEALFYPSDAPLNPDVPAGWEQWPANRLRREALGRYRLTLARMHGSLDEYCVFDAFACLLGLGQPVVSDGRYVKVYEVGPCALGDLVERVKAATGLSSVRVSAPRGMEQTVQRVGLPWGGMALFVNVGYQQQLLAAGCDVLIAGESDSYGFLFPAEAGVPMIETSHEASENPGLREFAGLLGKRFPELRVTFFENPTVWSWA